MNSSAYFLLAVVLIVAGVVLAAMSVLRRGGSPLSIDKYRKRWIEIESQLSRADVRSHLISVLEADKLLDGALKECGTKGETMGERLKAKNATWSDANGVWGAHKLRNQAVHESGIQIGYDDAKRALASFKRALKDIGAI